MTQVLQILVVDDDPVVLRLVKRILTRDGYSVLTVENPEEAWELIVDNRLTIDLLLTDIGMPSFINGIELAQRAQKQRPSLPILLTTGTHILDRYPREVVLYWQQRLLRKPFSVERLLAMMRQSLGSPTLQACRSCERSEEINLRSDF
jgi:two-component system cell cycle sensor histidine kinase/response regulator CckA